MIFPCRDQKGLANLQGNLHSKSSNELTEELELKLLGADPDKGIDPETLEAYLDAIEEQSSEEIPSFDVQASLSRFKTEHSVPQKVTEPSTREAKYPRRRVFKALYAACLVVLLLLTYSCATNFQWVKSLGVWGVSFFHLGPETSGQLILEQADESGFSSLEDALSAYGLSGTGPNWIPAEYAIENVFVNSSDGRDVITAVYESDDAGKRPLFIRIIMFDTSAQEPDVWYERDEENVQDFYTVNGDTYSLMTNEDTARATWKTDSCYCSISGQLSETQLKEIIDSIYEGSV